MLPICRLTTARPSRAIQLLGLISTATVNWFHALWKNPRTWRQQMGSYTHMNTHTHTNAHTHTNTHTHTQTTEGFLSSLLVATPHLRNRLSSTSSHGTQSCTRHTTITPPNQCCYWAFTNPPTFLSLNVLCLLLCPPCYQQHGETDMHGSAPPHSATSHHYQFKLMYSS